MPVTPPAPTIKASAKPVPEYRRILLKLVVRPSGGEAALGIDPEAVHDMARQVKEVQELAMEVAIVIGGGNIFRGHRPAAAAGMERGAGALWACWRP
jgi:uridylate kinase